MICLEFRGSGPEKIGDPPPKTITTSGDPPPLPGFDSYIYQSIALDARIPNIKD